jgi:hypothetical protein
MEWGKFVLFFQAVVTLIFGLIFFSQMITTHSPTPAAINSSNDNPIPQLQSISDFGYRMKVAAYVLLFVALIEFVIISRFI